MDAAKDAPHVVVQSMKLTTENEHEFWNAAWTHDYTGWRKAEEAPSFTRHVYVFACNVPGSTAGAPIPMPSVMTADRAATKEMNGPAEEEAVRQFLTGKSVLVPLCGDTGAVRYMVDHGAKLVVGADLAAEGLRRQRAVHFPDVSFRASPHTLADGTTVTEYEGHEGTCTVRFYEGNFLALPELPSFTSGHIDFVYDRASMMAMHPSMREAYVKSIAACLAPHGAAMVERPVRDAGDVSGPPFTFEAEQVRALYEAGMGRNYDVRTMLENRWYGNPDPGMPHYFEFFRVYPTAH